MSKEETKEFPGAGAWEREFGFLKEFGLECVYLTILLIAGSKSEIRWLVGLLPDYARLLRNDVIRLEDFWQRHFKKAANVDRSGLAVEDNRWVLHCQCSDVCKATGYYLRVLRNASEIVEGSLTPEKYILASPASQGRGCNQFSAALFGKTFEASCELITNPLPQVIVRIEVLREQLTEQFTHDLLGLSQKNYQISVGASSLLIYLSVDDHERRLSGMLELSEVRSHPVATPEFLQAVGWELCKHKIAPVCNIQPRFTEES